MRSLEGRVAVVAGATRGAGRGIACALGEAGAAVYCTGRALKFGRPVERGVRLFQPGGHGGHTEFTEKKLIL